MTQFYALTPKQAIKAVNVVGVQDAARLIRDHAVAGLVKTYAQGLVTIDAHDGRSSRRGGLIAAETWEGMIREGVDVDQQRPAPQRAANTRLSIVAPADTDGADDLASSPSPKPRPNPTAIPPGAILCTIKQAGDALGSGRTKVNDLMNSRQLERADDIAGVRITVASVRKLAGMAD